MRCNFGGLMLSCSLLAITLSISACTSLQPTQAASSEEVRRQITQENLIEPGDRVKVVTADGSVHEFRVTAVDRDAGLIKGKDEEVRIDDVVGLETREFSLGKTAALTLVSAGVIHALVVLAAAPALILAAGM
jgi:hypothetical protein